MKKTIVAGVILAVGFFIYIDNKKASFNIIQDSPILSTKEEIERPPTIKKLTDKGKTQFKKKLSKEVSESEILETILDFSVSPKEVLKKINNTNLIKNHINKAIPEILDCIPTLCGAERTEDGFISESGSLAHESIERYLEIAQELQNKSEATFLDDELIISVASVDNIKIQKLIVEIIGSNISNKSIVNNFLEKFNGEALSKLIQKISLVSKEESLNLMEDALENENSYNIIELAKGLKDMPYDKEEVLGLAPKICHLKNNETEKHNYLMSKLYFNKKAHSNGYEIDWSIICL